MRGRSILIDYLYWKVIDREKIEKAEKIEKLKDYRIINPILNKFYNDNRLKYKVMYGGKCVEYDAYKKGEKDLDEYIVNNVDSLDGKTSEELTSIYTKVFNDSTRKYFLAH